MKALLRVLTLATMLAAGSAHAAIITIMTTLSGPAESPPNMSPGTGAATITLDTTAHMMSISASFSGLTGTTTASHIHCCTTTPFAGIAGVATQTPSFSGFPLGVTSGTFNNTFDLTLAGSWNPAFVTAQGGISQAEAALTNGMLTGRAYFNIHTTAFMPGEIRGFLAPEPGTLALLGVAALGLAALRRASRQR